MTIPELRKKLEEIERLAGLFFDPPDGFLGLDSDEVDRVIALGREVAKWAGEVGLPAVERLEKYDQALDGIAERQLQKEVEASVKLANDSGASNAS